MQTVTESKKKKLILLVEDDAIDRESVKRVFDKNQVKNEIVIAVDGLEALNILHKVKTQRIEGPYPSLILLDINLPKINGLELLKEIKTHPVLNEIPVVVLTTSERNEDKDEALALGAIKYLTKPLKFDEIAEFVHRQ